MQLHFPFSQTHKSPVKSTLGFSTVIQNQISNQKIGWFQTQSNIFLLIISSIEKSFRTELQAFGKH